MFFKKLCVSENAIVFGFLFCLLSNSSTLAMEKSDLEGKSRCTPAKKGDKEKEEEKEKPWTPNDAPTLKGVQDFLDRTLCAPDIRAPLDLNMSNLIYIHLDISGLIYRHFACSKVMDEKDAMNSLVSFCRDSHPKVTGLRPKKADVDFFESDQHFMTYLRYLDDTNYKLNEEQKNTAKFYYNLEAARYFLKHSHFEKVKQHYLTCESLDPRFSLTYMESDFLRHLLDPVTALRKKSPSEIKKIAEIYKDFLMDRGIDEEEYDVKKLIFCVMLSFESDEFEKALAYAEKALEKPWPLPDDPSYLCRISQLRMQSHYMAQSYYFTNRHNEALKIWSNANRNSEKLTPEEYLFLAHIYTQKHQYVDAYNNFLIFILNRKKNSLINIHRRTDEVHAIAMVEMLLKLNKSKFNEAVKRYILVLEEIFPSIKNKVEDIRSSLIQKDRKKSSALIATAIATEKVEYSKEIYRSYDTLYTSLWARVSFLGVPYKDFLERIDMLSKEIEDTFYALSTFNILEEDNNFTIFTENYNKLINLFDEFTIEANQARLNIDKARQDLLKSQQKGNEDFQHSTWEQSTNLKKEYSDKDCKNKEKTKKENKSNHNMNNKNIKKEQSRKKEDTPSKETEEKLKSFSSKETETIWTLRDADAHEGKALELLDLLNNTKSMHHLRTMTLPGTQLEKLKGDRKGQVSLRVIGPYRLCFNWTPGVGATNIEIVDYHR